MEYEEWIKIGNMAKTIHQKILDEITSRRYNKTSKEMRWLRAADKACNTMRDKLDELVYDQLHHKIPKDDIFKIFYGPIKEEAS